MTQNHAVAESIRQFLLYIKSASLLDGFVKNDIPREYIVGYCGSLKKSYLKKNKKTDTITVTTEGMMYIRTWLK